ncbi:hypothetical protein DFR48_107208 [Ciceribacter lividus]|uniref:Uncharacterized protein n=1 Tax=Ciceribacter lividus TaxID=1197950 RepID=A0A6I7HLF8_9HYPH|nr:hypothetical protein DFR48_107208 [Ciceribacter lividus]
MSMDVIRLRFVAQPQAYARHKTLVQVCGITLTFIKLDRTFCVYIT